MTEEMNEYCGVFGCVTKQPNNDNNVAQVICLGLVAIQHRGQESAGIVVGNGDCAESFNYHKGKGLVSNVFNSENMAGLKGSVGIGHTRYSTTGGTETHTFQPFIIHTIHGEIAVAHNGQLINAKSLRKKVMERGVGLSTQTDSEVLTQLLTLSPPEGEPNGPNWPARIENFMKIARISYSLLILHGDTVYAIRDPFGNRPLCLGLVASENNEAWVVSSESCAFQSIGAKYQREVNPGEIVEISRNGLRSIKTISRPDNAPPALCIFEYIYFSRADTLLEEQMVYTVRKKCGQQLAKEAPVCADLVSTVPESATPAAMGYSEESGIPYVEVLCKNRYVGRTFIQPNENLRKKSVNQKFGVLEDNVKNKRIILVDDSIVRGTTIGPIINLLRKGGAKEIHIRVGSPPIKHPCYMGINIPTKNELIANKFGVKEMAEHFGADSIKYLSVDGLKYAVTKEIQKKEENSIGHCTACLTGNYPVDLDW
ncbi:Amidophosphoribosyltransferase [Nymphon striatum]|nr:Amidophosphoribosyltransferase [Nymphon striatum]